MKGNFFTFWQRHFCFSSTFMQGERNVLRLSYCLWLWDNTTLRSVKEDANTICILLKRSKYKSVFCLQSDFRNHLYQNCAPLAVVLSGHMTSPRQIWVRGQKWPQMVSKWPQNNPEIAQNDLNGFKVTSKTISIEIPPFLRSFWVVTWLECNKFEFGATNWSKVVLKWAQNDPKIA